jgi:uracil-DNA glycosylase
MENSYIKIDFQFLICPKKFLLKIWTINYEGFLWARGITIIKVSSTIFRTVRCVSRNLFSIGIGKKFFRQVVHREYFREIEEQLSEYLAAGHRIVPDAELLFNAFNTLDPKEVRCVIFGQDPYPGVEDFLGCQVPHAIGLSFAVPYGVPKPPTLENIYRNLYQYGHIENIPDHGSLVFWVLQSCFLFNASLTGFPHSRGSHLQLWTPFVRDLIEYFNQYLENRAFLIWGKKAHLATLNLDPHKHLIITSSHPSPLGAPYQMKGYSYGTNPRFEVRYPAFHEVDHFGRVNSYLLEKWGTSIIF